MTDRALDGLTIGVTADRRAAEQAQLLEQRGAKVLHGPVLQTVPIEDHEPARKVTEELLRRRPDVVVANTAVGIRTWLSLADAWGVSEGVGDLLGDAYVAARGSKAAGALLAVGIEIDWKAPSSVLAEVLDHLDGRGVAGRRIAVQRDGGPAEDAFAAALRERGADVVEIATYRWTLPKDPAPALRLIDAACDGRLDAVTFTAAPAVHNLFDLAAGAGIEDALRTSLNGPVVAMCVGPVCLAAAIERGVVAAKEPQTARLGGMVKALEDELAARRRTLDVDGADAVVQGSLVRAGGTGVSLPHRERAVFDVLSRRPGVVVPRRVLLTEVWGSDQADGHALEVTVGRLRRRLEPTGLRVEAVLRRGYRLTS
jgi:uroporphyrinogen-III synthase